MKKKLLLIVGAALAICGCSGLRILDLITPNSDYTVTKDVAYDQGPRQKLDIYAPVHPAAGHPVLLFFYGGSWQSGSKNDYRFVAQAFATKGFYTVLADYRLYPEVSFPSFLQDGARALVWTHRHIAEYGGNPDNLFVSGHSSGAYNALMLVLNHDYVAKAGGKNEWIKGGIGIAGPYDFLPFTDPKIKAIFSTAPDPDTQPIHYVSKDLPPLLLLHGDEDEEVYPRNTKHLAAKLEKYGDPVTVHLYPGIAHKGILLALARGFRGKCPTLDDIAAFVTSHLSPDSH